MVKNSVALITLAFGLLAASAEAQVRVGSVTITRPGDVKPAPAAPAPATTAPRSTPRTAAPATNSNSSGSVAAPRDLPNGWNHIEGRVIAEGNTRLPSGSSIQVSILEVGAGGQSSLLDIRFRSSALSTPYSIRYNPARMSAGNRYVLSAKVFDGNGRLIYTTKQPVNLPRTRAAQVNIRVSPL